MKDGVMPPTEIETATIESPSGLVYRYEVKPGERWTVYRDDMLVVTHPERKPFRVYWTGDDWVREEIKPAPMAQPTIYDTVGNLSSS